MPIHRPRHMGRMLLLLLLSSSIPLWACRNDADVQRDEQEFRAAYGAAGGAGSGNALLAQGLVILLLAVGVVLVLLALKAAAATRMRAR